MSSAIPARRRAPVYSKCRRAAGGGSSASPAAAVKTGSRFSMNAANPSAVSSEAQHRPCASS